MKSVEISVPKSLNDFTIKHSAMLIQLSKRKESFKPTMLNKCKHVSMYSGVDISEVKRMDVNDINKVFNHCINELTKYTKKEPPKELTLNGTTYCLIELNEQTGGWLIDYEAQSELFESNPEKWVAMAYIEKGKQYGDVPNGEREQVFLEHFPARVMFDLSDFFLLKYHTYLNATVLLMTKRLKMRKTIRTMFRKRKRTNQTSK